MNERTEPRSSSISSSQSSNSARSSSPRPPTPSPDPVVIPKILIICENTVPEVSTPEGLTILRMHYSTWDCLVDDLMKGNITCGDVDHVVLYFGSQQLRFMNIDPAVHSIVKSVTSLIWQQLPDAIIWFSTLIPHLHSDGDETLRSRFAQFNGRLQGEVGKAHWAALRFIRMHHQFLEHHRVVRRFYHVMGGMSKEGANVFVQFIHQQVAEYHKFKY